MSEGWFNQVYFENNLESRVDENEKIFTQKMWLLKAISIMTKLLSLLYKPVDDGVLVRGNIQMKTGELVMLQCVAFLVDVSATLVFERDNFSATPSTYPTSSPNIFYSFLEGALGLANPLNAFSFHWLFCLHLLSNTTLIPSKVPD